MDGVEAPFSGETIGTGVATDTSDNVYVTGDTFSLLRHPDDFFECRLPFAHPLQALVTQCRHPVLAGSLPQELFGAAGEQQVFDVVIGPQHLEDSDTS